MKKLYLLFCLTSITMGFSQQLISFETSEGYILGDINGQDNWTVSASGPNFIANQDVVDENATDGTFSLKLAEDSDFGDQALRNTGGFYPFNDPLDVTSIIISFDINMSELGTTSYEVSFDDFVDNITGIIFESNGDIAVITNEEDDGSGLEQPDILTESWLPQVWYNIRFEINTNALEVFIDDTSVYTGFVNVPDIDILRTVCLHDNKGGFFYFDNFRINNESLSTTELAQNSFEFRYAQGTKELLLSSPVDALEELRIYNLLGQEVMAQRLTGSNEAIFIEGLSSGLYVAQIKTSGRAETLKFLVN